MAWHVEMEPSRPADPRLKAVEVRHRDHDPAVPAEHLDRSAQTQRRVVKVLEHVPEDGNVGDLACGAPSASIRACPEPAAARRPRRVRLDADDAVPLFRQPTEEPAVARRRSRSRAIPARAGRAHGEQRRPPRRPQRLEQQVDGSGRRSVGAAPIQARRIVSGATDRHRRAARTAAVEPVERRRRPAVGTANRKPGLHRGATAGDAAPHPTPSIRSAAAAERARTSGR